MSELPDGWIEVTLGDILTDVRNGTTAEQNKDGIGLPVTRIECVQGNSLHPQRFGYISEYSQLAHFLYEVGDIVFSHINSLAHVGKVALYDGTPPKLLHGMNLLRLRSIANVDPSFLYWAFLSPAMRDAVRSISRKSVNQVSVNQKELASISIGLPSLPEQRRIVSKIESLTARSRRAKEALDAIPKLLEQFRQSVLASAFRGDLTAAWRAKNPDVEPAEVLLKRIRIERRKRWEEAELAKMRAKGKTPADDKWKAKYEEPAPVDTSELPELPEGWAWASADEITSFITDGEHATPPRSSDGVMLLSARNVLNGRLSFDKVDYIPEDVYDALCKRLTVQSGDVLLSCSGSVGRCCVVPSGLRFALVRSVAVLRPVLAMAEYLAISIQSPVVQRQIEISKTETAQANIFQGRIKRLAIPIAPLREQAIIADTLGIAITKADRIAKITLSAQSRLSDENRSILSKAFRGELVPQDPADEPASVLLARIRGEAAKPGAVKPKRGRSAKTTQTNLKMDDE